MKNKSIYLNVLLALIIVVLVFQLATYDKNSATKKEQSHAGQLESTQLDIKLKIGLTGQHALPEKKSVGKRGWIMPKPALVIGSYSAKGEPDMMTAAWAGIVNSDPLYIGVSIRPSRKTYENIKETGFFSISVPSAQYVAQMDYIGNVSGHDENKFEKLGLTPVHGNYANAPYVGEFPIVIECRVVDSIPLGSHTQFIGEVLDTKIDSAFLTADNQVNIEKLQPIIFDESYYYGYGRRLGKPFDIYKLLKPDMEPSYTPQTFDNPTMVTIFNRKSVRHFTEQPVSVEQLKLLVQAGMAAPTAVNKQPWAFIAIKDRQMLDKLGDALPYAKMLKQAAAAIVVCGDLTKALEDEAQAYWIQDCSAASENILLAAESLGLGAVWTGVHPIKEREDAVRQTLNAPETIVPLNVIVIGYPTGEDKPKNKWNEANVHWEHW